MAKRWLPLTCGQMVVVVVLLGPILLLLLLALPRSAEESRRAKCTMNCNQIGRAMDAYRQDNGGFFPFVRSSGGPRGGIASPTECDASLSLGALYPHYISSAKVFGCPSIEDEPVLTPYREGNAGAYGIDASGWSLGYTYPTWPSYGYDPRTGPRSAMDRVILADMDGTPADAGTQNHCGRQSTLYVDGHVAWTDTNYASNDPNDNIFTEAYKPANPTQGWHADTDSFMVRGSIALTSSYTYAEFKSLW